MGTHETLRTEAEARRSVAGRPAAGRYTDAIARYLGACDYGTYGTTKDREEEEKKDEDAGEDAG